MQIEEFKRYVCEVLISNYHMDEAAASTAMQKSILSKALEKDEEFVIHDTVEEWAEIIYSENVKMREIGTKKRCM